VDINRNRQRNRRIRRRRWWLVNLDSADTDLAYIPTNVFHRVENDESFMLPAAYSDGRPVTHWCTTVDQRLSIIQADKISDQCSGFVYLHSKWADICETTGVINIIISSSSSSSSWPAALIVRRHVLPAPRLFCNCRPRRRVKRTVRPPTERSVSVIPRAVLPARAAVVASEWRMTRTGRWWRLARRLSARACGCCAESQWRHLHET